MSQRKGSRTFYVLGFLVLALAALAGNWRLDVMRRAGRYAASSINNHLRLAEQSLAELRGAQAGYLAAGQPADEWMNKATALSAQLESAIANLAATSTSPDARPHYAQAAALVGDVSANDRKARSFVASEQPLVASDLLFQEGAEPARKLAAEIAAARDAELAWFEKSATRLGWIGVGVNGAAFAIGWLLIVMGSRGRKSESAEALDAGLHLNTPAPAASTPEPRVSDTPEPVVDPFVAPPVELSGAAELCVDLGRILDGRDLPALMARAAGVLEAKGLVLWISEAGGRMLRPSIAHGYSDRVLQRMGTLPADGDNVTSLAFRTLQPQVIRGPIGGHGAFAVPLITANGCVGVLAAEVQGAKPGDARFALARIIAAQLSTVVGPGSAAASKAAEG